MDKVILTQSVASNTNLTSPLKSQNRKSKNRFPLGGGNDWKGSINAQSPHTSPLPF